MTKALLKDSWLHWINPTASQSIGLGIGCQARIGRRTTKLVAGWLAREGTWARWKAATFSGTFLSACGEEEAQHHASGMVESYRLSAHVAYKRNRRARVRECSPRVFLFPLVIVLIAFADFIAIISVSIAASSALVGPCANTLRAAQPWL